MDIVSRSGGHVKYRLSAGKVDGWSSERSFCRVKNSAYLTDGRRNFLNIGAVQIFAKIHKCEKVLRMRALRSSVKAGGAGSSAPGLAVLGDELHDFHGDDRSARCQEQSRGPSGTTIFQRQSEMQHAQAMLAQAAGTIEFAVFTSQLLFHLGAPRGVHDR